MINLVSLTLVLAGVALIATMFVGPFWSTSNSSSQDGGSSGGEFNVPTLQPNQSEPSAASKGPEDKTLELTVPQMRRVENAKIPTAEGADEEALRTHTAIHLKGTGFPWQKEANVYIAGHRLGYPSTGSFLAFYDLDVLKKGDEITVKDSEGKKYTYKVYEKEVVDPSQTSVTQPVEGKNILTLQTCTLPDYSQRLIVHAEKVN